jgi:hypothetical protein
MKPIRKQNLLLLGILLLSFLLPAPVQAAGDDPGLFYGDTVPAGVSVDHDVVLLGQEVTLEGTVNGNVFILGNQVVVTGRVDGSLILIAQNAAIGGEVTGAVYAVALTLDLPVNAVLVRDLYTFTVSLTSKPDSLIGRHLYALGLDAGLNGEIGGELHTLLGPIQLYNGLMRLLGFEELTLELHFDIPQDTTTPQGSLDLRHLKVRFLEPLPAFDWGRWGLTLLRSWAVLFLFGLLVLWLGRKPLARSAAPLQHQPWLTLALGLIVLVVSMNLFVVALILAVLVFAIGLGLNFLGLWPLTLVFWVLAFSALLLGVLALWFLIAYGSKLVLIFAVVSWLAGKITTRKAFWVDLLAVLAGTVVFALLRSLPYAGWVIDLLVTVAGMGALWSAWRRSPVSEPAAAQAKAVKTARKGRK